MDWQEFFGDVISVYTDADALEDGVLVDISALNVSFRGMPINRMTGHLWSDFQEMEIDNEAIAEAIKTKCEAASCAGGIWTVPPKLWLIENEVDGFTMMHPEDY
jgi:hypothetical protein